MHREMGIDLLTSMIDIRENPRPGLVNALLNLEIDGGPAPDHGDPGQSGADHRRRIRYDDGALTAHALEWLSAEPGPTSASFSARERASLLDQATEEFLRYFTPAAGDGRTFSEDIEIEGTSVKRR